MFDLIFNIICFVFIIIGLSSVIVYALPVPKDKKLKQVYDYVKLVALQKKK
jgi:hypothetical protein